ncbi:MAG: SHOCT domain-containing protein [Bacilli bacterium]
MFYGQFGPWTGWMLGMMGVMVIGMIAFVAILVLVVYWIVRAVSGTGRGYVGTGTGEEDSALRLVRERYARGEIDHEEYERLRDRLRN